MTTAVIFTALIPISLMLVVGLILLSGAMSAARRRSIERAIIFVLFPAAALLWAWRGVQAYAEHDWTWVLGSIAMILVTAASSANLWRKSARPDGTRT
jgi:hypothetical protein